MIAKLLKEGEPRMAEGPVSGVPAASPSANAVREELARILASHEFRTSKRSQEFLRYVVEHTLSGEAGILKERTIGIEVFGRSTSYDPSDDATVRVKAGEVRKRLDLYYAHQGAQDTIRIEMPAGTYVPEFHSTSAEIVERPVTRPTSVVPVAAASPPLRRTARDVWIGAAFLAVAIGLAVLVWVKTRPANTALDHFWSPVLDGTAPVSLCAAFVPVYSLDRDPKAKLPPPKPEDFTYLADQFVGGGDLIAVSRLSAMLTRMQRPYQVRMGSAVSFHDLRAAPAVLVGYSYTRWKEISSQMRYFIDVSPGFVGITDTGVPTKWALPNLPADRHTNEDYAIVSRVFHPDTHAMLVELAGITQYGTDAAADLVTNGDLLAEALRGAPQGWRNKNLQLVLHVKVISGAPASPRVVGSHFW
jgi:hypothetical protein